MAKAGSLGLDAEPATFAPARDPPQAELAAGMGWSVLAPPYGVVPYASPPLTHAAAGPLPRPVQKPAPQKGRLFVLGAKAADGPS